MGKTYKDRDQKGLPRVPEWARAKPTIPHKRKDKDDPKHKGQRFDEDPDWIQREWDRA